MDIVKVTYWSAIAATLPPGRHDSRAFAWIMVSGLPNSVVCADCLIDGVQHDRPLACHLTIIKNTWKEWCKLLYGTQMRVLMRRNHYSLLRTMFRFRPDLSKVIGRWGDKVRGAAQGVNEHVRCDLDICRPCSQHHLPGIGSSSASSQLQG